METGGQLGQKVSKPATESSELIGILAAMVILTFTFGTVVSMLMPILNAIIGLAAALAIVEILGHVMTVSTVAPTLATMIGLGVGIDYALFIVTRHCAGSAKGWSVRESIARAAATSGGAVVFAGGTVTIALAVAGRGRHPAGDHDGPDGGDRRGRRRAGRDDAAAGDAGDRRHRTSTRCGSVAAIRARSPGKQGMWARWAAGVARRPVIAGHRRAGDPDPAARSRCCR